MAEKISMLWLRYIQAKNELCAALGCREDILSEFAEHLVAEAENGDLLPSSFKPADVKLSDGRLIQVKALAFEDEDDIQVSITHLWGYDFLALLLFNKEGRIAWAGEVPAEVVRRLAWQSQDCWTFSAGKAFRSRDDVRDVSSCLCALFDLELPPWTTQNSGVGSENRALEATASRDHLLSLTNKKFAFACMDVLKGSSTLETDIKHLLDSNFCRQSLKHSFAILKDATGKTPDEIRVLVRDSHGNRRYYESVLMLNGGTYVISNDWYGLGNGGKDNRTPFAQWVRDRAGLHTLR